MLPIVQVINSKQLRWFGSVMRRVRVNAKGCHEVKYEGKESKRRIPRRRQTDRQTDRQKNVLRSVMV